jgi:hypothetical protein
MDNEELKEELGQLGMRLDNVEGHFENFDTTLNNHMNDYGSRQDQLVEKVAKMAEKLAEMKGREDLAGTLIRWVIFPLIVILAGLIGIRLIWPGG